MTNQFENLVCECFYFENVFSRIKIEKEKEVVAENCKMYYNPVSEFGMNFKHAIRGV